MSRRDLVTRVDAIESRHGVLDFAAAWNRYRRDGTLPPRAADREMICELKSDLAEMRARTSPVCDQ